MSYGEQPLTPKCKHPARYRDEPRGYLAWFDWVERVSKKHRQELCEHCGLWAIWRSKKSGRMMARAR